MLTLSYTKFLLVFLSVSGLPILWCTGIMFLTDWNIFKLCSIMCGTSGSCIYLSFFSVPGYSCRLIYLYDFKIISLIRSLKKFIVTNVEIADIFMILSHFILEPRMSWHFFKSTFTLILFRFLKMYYLFWFILILL